METTDKRLSSVTVDDGMCRVAAHVLQDTIKKMTKLVGERTTESEFTKAEIMRMARLVFLYEGLRYRLSSDVGEVHMRVLRAKGALKDVKQVIAVMKHHLTEWFTENGSGPEEGRAFNLMSDGFDIAELFAEKVDGMGFLDSSSPGGSLNSIMMQLGSMADSEGHDGTVALRARHALHSYVVGTVIPQIGMELMMRAAEKNPKLAAALARSGITIPGKDGDDTKTVITPFPVQGSGMAN